MGTVQVSVPVPKSIHAQFKAACALRHMKIEDATIEALKNWTKAKDLPEKEMEA